MSTTTTEIPKFETVTPTWIENGGEAFRPLSQLTDDEVARGMAAIVAALAEAGRPHDEQAAAELRTRLHADSSGKLYLHFRTTGKIGHGFAPVAAAVALLVDPARSPERAFARRENEQLAAGLEAQRLHLAAERRRREQRDKDEEERRELEEWNARNVLETAILQAPLYAPKFAGSEMLELLLIVVAILEQQPKHWTALPPGGIHRSVLKLKELGIFTPEAVIETAREGFTLLKNVAKSGRGLPGGREIEAGQVREVPNAIAASAAVQRLISVGDLIVVDEAAFIAREAE